MESKPQNLAGFFLSGEGVGIGLRFFFISNFKINDIFWEISYFPTINLLPKKKKYTEMENWSTMWIFSCHALIWIK